MKNLYGDVFLAVIFVLFGWSALSAVDPGQPEDRDDADVLKPFNSMVGSWRGVGQPQRGSKRGAWTEKAVCEWNFEQKQPAIVLKTKDGNQFRSLRLTWDKQAGKLVLIQKTDDFERRYSGPMPKSWPERIQLVSKPDADGVTYRCTIQQLTDIRSTLLFEKQNSPTGSFRRVAGIGYTRAGAKLAQAGGNQRTCIVTGGLGTIAVSYKNETYYVCCQGCVQAFNDDPAGIIAEYKASLKKEKEPAN